MMVPRFDVSVCGPECRGGDARRSWLGRDQTFRLVRIEELKEFRDGDGIEIGE